MDSKDDYHKPFIYKVVTPEEFNEIPPNNPDYQDFLDQEESDIPVARVGMSQLEDLSHMMLNNNEIEILTPGIRDFDQLQKENLPLLQSIIKGVQLQNIEDCLIIALRSARYEISPVELLESIYPTHDEVFIQAHWNIIRECEKYIGRCNYNNWRDFAKLYHLLWKDNHCYSAKTDPRSAKPATDGWLFGCEFVRNIWLYSILSSDIDERIQSFEKSIGANLYENTSELDTENSFVFCEPLMELYVIWSDRETSWKNQYFIQPDRVVVNIKDRKVRIIDNKIGKQFKSKDSFDLPDNAQQSLVYLASSLIFSPLASAHLASQFSVNAEDVHRDNMFWMENEWKSKFFQDRGKRRFPRVVYLHTPGDNQVYPNSTSNFFRDGSRNEYELIDVTPNIEKDIGDLKKLSKYAINHKAEFRKLVRDKKRNRWFVMPQFPSSTHCYQEHIGNQYF